MVSERTLSREQAQEFSMGTTNPVPVSFATLTENTVVLARILQDDGINFKARPCVVVSIDVDHVDVHPVTSSPLAAGRLALEIDFWRESGLHRPSAVLHRRVRLDDERDVLEVMGTLHPLDADRLSDSVVTTVSAIPFEASLAS
jgi:hypothetical protein